MEEKSSHWITISDMMSGIMMIFMMIAVAFMVTIENDKKQLEMQHDKMRDLAQNYSNLQNELYKDLMKEFGKDLKRWDAFIDEDTTIRFQKQDILFDVGEKRVKERFQKILDDFFPRFIAILYNEKYRDSCQRQGVPMQADHGRHAPLQARNGQGGHRDVWWLVRRVRLPVLLHRVGVQGRRR